MANTGVDQTVTAGVNVNFDASGSTDNYQVRNYLWDFGDGTTGTGETTSHAFTELGTYTVTLTVEDIAGNQATDTLTITVADEASFGIVVPGVLIIGVIGAAVMVFLLRRK